MSAALEELFQQIVELEFLIGETKAAGQDTRILENRLFDLKEKFTSLNENLGNAKKVLKG